MYYGGQVKPCVNRMNEKERIENLERIQKQLTEIVIEHTNQIKRILDIMEKTL